jgi:hypothetical protein
MRRCPQYALVGVPAVASKISLRLGPPGPPALFHGALMIVIAQDSAYSHMPSDRARDADHLAH